jgi:hypothetical protein
MKDGTDAYHILIGAFGGTMNQKITVLMDLKRKGGRASKQKGTAHANHLPEPN